MRRYSLMVAVALLSGGCDDGEENTSAVASDMGAEADAGPRIDADSTADAELADAGSTVDPDAEPGPTPRRMALGPVVTATEPAELSPEWLVAAAPPNQPDPIIDSLLDGTFEPPPGPGWFGGQVNWRLSPPSETGVIADIRRSGVSYAVTTIAPGAGGLIVQADRTAGVYVEGIAQPGDIYGRGLQRVPFAGADRERVLVARVIGGRADPRVRVFTTPDEIYLNTADLTFPDLRVGDDRPRPIGMAVLNLTDHPGRDLVARVMPSAHFEGSEVRWPSLPAGAVTQLGFELVPKQAFAEAGATIPVTVRIESLDFDQIYEQTLELTVKEAEIPWRETFRSPVDGSIQYYGVQAPAGWGADGGVGGQDAAALLALHGAGVEAINFAGSYSKHPETFVFAPTNRRPFGFDWEEWGRLNALAALDDAQSKHDLDPTRIYLAGHSMGGHGTWHVGVSTPGRFATMSPSAGWSSFQTYVRRPAPRGAFARARAHSTTNNYVTNLARRGVFVIHGSADDNVPVREARQMVELVTPIVEDLVFHEEPGAGHWWDGDVAEGVDCVDWPPLFEFMSERRLDPNELDFSFRSEAPGYSGRHSFVTLHSAISGFEDVTVSAASDGEQLALTTTNVRSLELDGTALSAAGISSVTVDGEPLAVEDGAMQIGPATGKRPGQQGPYNQVYRAPFCFIYAEANPFYQNYAGWLTSEWSFIGNGHACALPWRDRAEAGERQRIYLGIPLESLGIPQPAFEWDAGGVTLDGTRHDGAAGLFVFPEGGGVAAALWAAEGSEALLYGVMPFGSSSGLPDYLVWSTEGALAAGFFDAEWQYDENLRDP